LYESATDDLLKLQVEDECTTAPVNSLLRRYIASTPNDLSAADDLSAAADDLLIINMNR